MNRYTIKSLKEFIHNWFDRRSSLTTVQGTNMIDKALNRGLKKYCLKKRGQWWATRFCANKEVWQLYDELSKQDIFVLLDEINDEEQSIILKPVMTLLSWMP